MLYRLKSFALVILGFLVVITLFSLLMPGTVVVVRSETIPSPKADILQAIQQPNSWMSWYPPLQEPGVSPHVEGEMIVWTSGGKKNTIHFQKIHREGLRTSFTRSGELPVLYDITLYEIDGIPQVEWKAIHQLRWYPWEKFGGIFMNDLAGQGYTHALQQLKAYVQSPR